MTAEGAKIGDYVWVAVFVLTCVAAWFKGSTFLAYPLWQRLTIALGIAAPLMGWIIYRHVS